MSHIGIFSTGFEPDPPIPPSILNQPRSTAQIRCPAGEAIGGHRAVYVDALGVAWYADPRMSTGAFLTGVTFGAAGIGEDLIICLAGRMEESGWDWAAGNVWLGFNGTLTQALPATDSLILLGVGAGPFLFVRPSLIAVR